MFGTPSTGIFDVRSYTLRWDTFALQSAGEPAVTSITLAGRDPTDARSDTVLQADASKKERIENVLMADINLIFIISC